MVSAALPALGDTDTKLNLRGPLRDRDGERNGWEGRAEDKGARKRKEK